MRYEHRFRVKAPLADVAAFHSRSANMPRLSPPPLLVRLHAAPEFLTSGDEMAFTIWAGPLPIRWSARIEDAGEVGFTDRQLRGPFAHWAHRHSFEWVDDTTTEVVDQIEAAPRRHPFWGLVGLAMWIGMPLLFAFRGWQTSRLLENRAS